MGRYAYKRLTVAFRDDIRTQAVLAWPFFSAARLKQRPDGIRVALTGSVEHPKKKNYRAAAKRFSEATKWNPTYAEAFLRLGEAEEKLRDKTAIRQAYEKYLELQPDAKNAAEIQKKLAGTR
ncbi:MAG: hypothetical protein M3Y27_11040 [Acidobacteriota bacterium]|nr:hypothetical protein [Acidobacteriota bacterium]